eukprot:gnl/MRDRNA2_/MRDRNA2_104657_c0_seq1.p1 gnl/MRDRNA2_/MRDRNA2_104657_c0~~gnl/MRDRNA2_/MRDRNA2_104657_c0_seq1.p1  ORF type:complete len:378 (+),score=51.24 gnl/MRDRNA2_/MRDRNA2_104657_c0_seq1:69-1202(+)
MQPQSRYYPPPLDLGQSRVLITGTTSGTGQACAFRFFELGCHLILVGRDEGKLQNLGRQLQENSRQFATQPPQPELVLLDVNDIDKIAELAHRMGPVDILINNAGVNLSSETVDAVHLGDMKTTVFTNYLAPMAFVTAFAPMMKKRGMGHIINVCSTAAFDVYKNSSAYCSTKAALAAYTIAARHDLVDTPIRVTAISPGLVDTPLHDKKMGSEKAKDVFENVVPLYPEDIADQIIYCCTRPRHVQIADIQSYATNQSHSGVNGIGPVARMGPTLGASMAQRVGHHQHNEPYVGRPPSSRDLDIQVRDVSPGRGFNPSCDRSREMPMSGQSLNTMPYGNYESRSGTSAYVRDGMSPNYPFASTSVSDNYPGSRRPAY